MPWNLAPFLDITLGVSLRKSFQICSFFSNGVVLVLVLALLYQMRRKRRAGRVEMLEVMGEGRERSCGQH